jgi:hypothetical protein
VRFLDQVAQMNGDPFEKKRLMWFGTKTVSLTFVLTADVARYLADALDADVRPGERIDIGWTRPVSMQEIADIASQRLGAEVRVRAVPAGLIRAVTSVVGLAMPGVKDMGGCSPGSRPAATSPTSRARRRSSDRHPPRRKPSRRWQSSSGTDAQRSRRFSSGRDPAFEM